MGLLSRILGHRRPPVPVTMYVRKPCKLCDVMKAELDRAGLAGEYELRIVDLDREGNEQLRSDHGQWVPVLEIGGKIAFKAHMPPGEFKKRFRKLAAEYHAAHPK